MRPRRLWLEGFSSFREPTTVDFDGVDYFALVGPTGSGKSSLIDAMAFALYGSVPRYEHKGLVAPIISQGRVEARVGLDFAVGGLTYRAVRVVRLAANGKGASTKEARLERIDGSSGQGDGPDGTVVETLAGDADSVTAAVTDLLGLSFEHFTKCVVLPQGAFARFLHDKPAARQDLLVELLNLGIYGAVGQRANAEATACADRAALAEAQLARPPLVAASAAGLRGARDRVVVLAGLRARVAAEEPALAELAASVAAAQAEVTRAQDRIRRLGSVVVPVEVAGLATDFSASSAAVLAGNADVEEAEAGAEAAESALAVLPARTTLEAALRHHDERADVVARLEKGGRVMVESAAGLAEAKRGLAQALVALDLRRRDCDRANHQHLAVRLAGTLSVGESCPVCRQPVPELPAIVAPADLVAAQAAVEAAEQERSGWVKEHQDREVRVARGEEQLLSLQQRLAAIDLALVGHTDAGVLTGALAGVVAAETALGVARDRVRGIRERQRAAVQRQDRAQAALAGAWAAFDRARDLVAELGPPAADRQDLAATWVSLADWAAGRCDIESVVAAQASDRAAAVDKERAARRAEAARWCRDADVVADGDRPLGEAVVRAEVAAAAAVTRLEEALVEARRLRDEADLAGRDAAVARALAGYLKASGFEKWLLDEVLNQLVAGATEVLHELSSGAYSLALDPAGSFAVLDHRNADAVRSARTLSGGETFLASLALALALAERLAGFGTSGAGLEAIFLDEGFGTLDPDTLDTVAAAIENLAAGGRVVGIITHVRDLAERVPVRFEVEKGPATSTVRRVEP